MALANCRAGLTNSIKNGSVMRRKRENLPTMLLSIFFSCAIVFGFCLRVRGDIHFSLVLFSVISICSCGIFCFLSVLWLLLDSISERLASHAGGGIY